MDIEILNKMFKDEDKKWGFIAKCVLTFDLSVDSISNILNMDKEEVYKKLIEKERIIAYKPNITLQSIAIYNFTKYFEKLKEAYLKKEKINIKRLLREINDYDVALFKKEHKKGDAIKEEDIISLVKFQLKYWVDSSRLCEMFNIDRANYYLRVKGLESKYPSLLSDWNDLTDYFKNSNSSRRFHG